MIRAPPAPEFHLSPELRHHLSFTTGAPSSPELRRHLSFATRAPRLPELHLAPELRRTRDSSSPELQDQRSTLFRAASSTELRRYLRFATTAPPARRFVLICRHLSFATRVPPSSELHFSPELHIHLPRLLHSMPFSFKQLPTSRQPFPFWPIPPAPPPSTPTIWDLFR